MSKTPIQWTEYNWNPFGGCTSVSAGCANCYARRIARRHESNPRTKRYKNGFEFTVYSEHPDEPLHWRKPQKVFLNTMSDTFHEDAPLEVIQRIFACIEKCPQHIFQVLTKRAERMAKLSAKLPWPDNIWVGVTVENADYLSRLAFLRQVPARVRFISFEPLLSAIPNINFQDIHWAIVGGESGPKARDMDLDWARDIRDQCLKKKIPFFFKQVGGKGRDKGGRLLDGREWNEYPAGQTSAVNTHKDQKVPAIIKGTIENTDVSFPWMVDGTLSRKSDGTCNALFVAPHGHRKDDTNTNKLGRDLAGELDAFAVINNEKYRRPTKDELGRPEETDLKKRVLDLNDPTDASECPQDYLDNILQAIRSINQRDGNSALVFFIHGISDKNADGLEGKPDIVVGKSFLKTYNSSSASGSESFFQDFMTKLNRKAMGAVRDDVPEYSGSTRMPPFLRWLAVRQGLKVEAVQIEFRWRDYRKTDEDIRNTAQNFAEVVRSLSTFASWEEEKMTERALDIVPKSKVKEIVAELRQRMIIKDDDGKQIDFTDDMKTSLVKDVESAYPVLAAATKNVWETGKFLHEVRERQKKNRLWMSFQKIVGLRKSQSNNYLRIYEGFGDRLSEYGYLGVSKLQDVARLKDPFGFLEAHKEEVEKADVRSVTEMVRAEVDSKRKKKAKREAQAVEVGSFRIKLATNGRVLTIQGLNKEMQNKLVEYLRGFESQEK